jgi:protein gp37
VFVNSVSDLSHADITDDFVLAMCQTMADGPQHTYQTLTKRHGRMKTFCNRLALGEPTSAETAAGHHEVAYRADDPAAGRVAVLPNVWLGDVSRGPGAPRTAPLSEARA